MTYLCETNSWKGIGFQWRVITMMGVIVCSVLGIMLPMGSSAQSLPLSGLPPISSSQESTYQLGPQDILAISVWKDEILSREVVVRPDGFISFPLIGEVLAEGRTVGSLEKEMNERLTKFVSDPRVSIGVTEVNSFKIFVIGKVNNPGGFQIGQYTDVMQALSLAGGLTPFAREGSIKVLRRRKNEGQTTFPFDYGEVLKGHSLEQNIVLERGDVVMVP